MFFNALATFAKFGEDRTHQCIREGWNIVCGKGNYGKVAKSKN